nr:hypothetical protein [uncultured Rahnella sp.]
MFKTFNTDWLKLTFCRIYQSGWTLVVLVVLSLWLCNFHGRNAFLVWWMALSGVVLIGFSVFLGNLPYRLIQPVRHVGRLTGFCSWSIWMVGVLLITLCPTYATSLLIVWLEPLGALIGVLFCCWVSRKGLLKWIR